MKKPHILNRSMFNRGGTSAYGRGITSNLVSEEQRQRFNYGGRVGYRDLGLVRPPRFTDNELFNEWGGLADIEVAEQLPGPYWTKPPEWTEDDGDYSTNREKQLGVTDLEDPKEYQAEAVVDPSKKITTLPADPASDVIDWETFAEGLYDKKGARGKALLGLAGNVLAASQQPKKEAAAILGKGMGEFGKTWASRKEKMEDIAATGKMYDKIYKTREEEKGKQARLTALEKTKSGNPWTDFQAASLALKDTDDAIAFATGETVINLTIDEETKQPIMPSDAQPGKIFKHPTTKQYYAIDKDGKPQPINLNKYLKNLKLA